VMTLMTDLWVILKNPSFITNDDMADIFMVLRIRINILLPQYLIISKSVTSSYSLVDESYTFFLWLSMSTPLLCNPHPKGKELSGSFWVGPHMLWVILICFICYILYLHKHCLQEF
jgi:hypothetical protein